METQVICEMIWRGKTFGLPLFINPTQTRKGLHPAKTNRGMAPKFFFPHHQQLNLYLICSTKMPGYIWSNGHTLKQRNWNAILYATQPMYFFDSYKIINLTVVLWVWLNTCPELPFIFSNLHFQQLLFFNPYCFQIVWFRKHGCHRI